VSLSGCVSVCFGGGDTGFMKLIRGPAGSRAWLAAVVSVIVRTLYVCVFGLVAGRGCGAVCLG
jgi:hypothetical protein